MIKNENGLNRKITLTDWHLANLNVLVVHTINTVEAETYQKSHLWRRCDSEIANYIKKRCRLTKHGEDQSVCKVPV